MAALRDATSSYSPKPIRVPAIALYAVPKSPQDAMRPWYDAADPRTKENVAALIEQQRASFRRHAQWFAEFSKGGRVAEIPGDHHLFLTNPADVLREIDSFLATLR